MIKWQLGGQLGDTEIVGLIKGNNRKNTNMREMTEKSFMEDRVNYQNQSNQYTRTFINLSLKKLTLLIQLALSVFWKVVRLKKKTKLLILQISVPSLFLRIPLFQFVVPETERM